MSDMSYTTKEKSQFMKVQGGEKKVMKKILSVALSTAMAFSMFASVAFGETAKATPQQAFDALAAKGILNGYPDGKAHLEKDLTRAEFAKIVTKLFGLTEVSGKLTYKDKGYTATNWAVPYIEAVTAAGLMQGQDTVKGIFNYNGKVTVEEVAAVLFRALKLEQPTTTDNNASAWAKGYAQAVINKGLIAQTVNFKGNATRSLVVETAYAVDQIGKVPTLTVATAEAVSPTKVVVTFSDKTTANVELTTALVAGVETTINFKHLEKDYTAKVTLQAPKVVSVTAPNAKQLVVKFNRAIDGETLVENTANGAKLIDEVVKVTRVNNSDQLVNANNANVVLASDGTEAWITFAGSEYLKGTYTVVIKDSVKTTAGEAIPAFTNLLTVADTTAPTVASVSSVAKTTTNKVYVKLSEPVKTAGLIAYVNGAPASVSRDTYAPLDEVTLNTGSALTSGATYDVSLTNLTDYAGNVANPNPTKASVTVTADSAAPTIVSATAQGDKKVKVVFNKNIDFNSLVGSVRLLDPNGELKSVMQINAGVDGKTFILTSTMASLPENGTFTGTIVFGASVRDTLGNTLGTALSQPITFTKDTVAPTVTSVTYKAGTGITIKFSEEVTYGNVTGLTLINDSTGVANTDLTYAGRSNDGKSLTFKVGTTAVVGAQTLRLPAGLAADTGYAKNKSAATVLPVSGSTASSDAERPTVMSAVYQTEDLNSADYVIRVTATDNSELNIKSLQDNNSYTLADAALPVGSYVTLLPATSGTPTRVAEVHIPKSSINETKNYKFTVAGIVDTAGNGLDVAFEQNIILGDRVKPTLSTAVVSSSDSKTMILTFSEAVKNADAGDFIFMLNGNPVSPSSFATIGNASLADKYYVTFNDANGVIDLNGNTVYTLTVKVRDEAPVANITDKEGNKVNTGTSITVK
ncbi:S-layer homology domain-containing protein [Paenibacillus tritici]|uniref:Ig-like domain-containing protein n=1 Tax=Paenibacillus tritici TaxID=1873425 RepID=UPI001BA89204|nr:Ig-like domain-containing protein [Paenibacillus tritici]QUL54570.1 S-layer homology domain-containing protein [Paenibacillus tritici]